MRYLIGIIIVVSYVAGALKMLDPMIAGIFLNCIILSIMRKVEIIQLKTLLQYVMFATMISIKETHRPTTY